MHRRPRVSFPFCKRTKSHAVTAARLLSRLFSRLPSRSSSLRPLLTPPLAPPLTRPLSRTRPLLSRLLSRHASPHASSLAPPLTPPHRASPHAFQRCVEWKLCAKARVYPELKPSGGVSGVVLYFTSRLQRLHSVHPMLFRLSCTSCARRSSSCAMHSALFESRRADPLPSLHDTFSRS